jgi:hypothetical protein
MGLKACKAFSFKSKEIASIVVFSDADKNAYNFLLNALRRRIEKLFAFWHSIFLQA